MLLGITRHDWVLYTKYHWALLDAIRYNEVFLGTTGYYKVLLGVIRYY